MLAKLYTVGTMTSSNGVQERFAFCGIPSQTFLDGLRIGCFGGVSEDDYAELFAEDHRGQLVQVDGAVFVQGNGPECFASLDDLSYLLSQHPTQGVLVGTVSFRIV